MTPVQAVHRQMSLLVAIEVEISGVVPPEDVIGDVAVTEVTPDAEPFIVRSSQSLVVVAV